MPFNDYLPSKSFQKKVFAIFGIIAAIVAIFFIVKIIILGVQKIKEKRIINRLPTELQAIAKTTTIGELQRKDSNNNGIADWEERLFGLDPLVNGEANKKTILDKKAQLKAEFPEDENTGVKDDTETAKFAQDYLTMMMTMEGSGVLSDEALNNIASAIGQNMTDYDLPDVFSAWDIKTVDDSNISKDAYLNKLLTELVKISKTNGADELNLIANALNNSTDANKAITVFAKTYKTAAMNMKDYYTPKSLMTAHLTIVNSLDHIGTALENMQTVATDPAKAAKGMMQYQIYSETLSNAVSDINNNY